MFRIENQTPVMSTTEATKDFVYAFVGTNGDVYVLGRSAHGEYVFNSINKTSKPKLFYGSIEDALKDKLESGKEVFAFENQTELAQFIIDLA